MKASEAFLWCLGAALMPVFLCGLARSEYQRVADIAEFRSTLAEAQAAEVEHDSWVADGSEPRIGQGIPEQALWSESRKAHFEASQSQAPGGVLRLLTIPAVDLEEPLHDISSGTHLSDL